MKDKSLFIIVIVSFIAMLLLLLIPDKKHQKELNYQNNLYLSFKQITTKTNDVYKLAYENEYGSNILNLLYYNKHSDDYLSFFIDKDSGRLVTFSKLLKKGYIDKFNEVERKLLYLKYPKFIADAILNKDVIKNYRILDNEIIVYYKNVETNPHVQDKFYLKINNNEVSDYLNYEFKLDKEYHNEDGFSYDSTKKYVAFTFDDGPSKANTKDVVDYLNENRAHATFFMLGSNMLNNPDIVKYVLEYGNEIGSHTYSHKNLKRISFSEVESEIKKTDNVYFDITGSNIKLLRPPYGAINEKIKENFSYPYILWNIDTLDWQYKDSDYLYNYVINHINDGDIILMHDIHETTKIAVERILPELYARGFRVVSVSELAAIKGIALESNRSYRSIK